MRTTEKRAPNRGSDQMFKRYMTKDQAKRAQSKRSLFASLKGQCSQFEVRQQGTSFVGGLQGDLATEFPGARIVAQYSQGYLVQD